MLLAWIKDKQKPVFEPRTIRRGKNKGKTEVKYLHRVNADGTRVYRKIINPILVTQR